MSASEWLNAGASVFSAVGTVGAFVVGGVVLWREHKTTAEQRVESAMRAETERRKQASQVTGWAVSTASDHYEARVVVLGQPTKIQYNVLNGSDGPVSDVVVLAPNELGAPRSNLAMGFIVPGSKSTKLEPDTSDGRSQDFYVPAPVPIFFTDTQGIRWFRDGQGALFEWSDAIAARLSEPWAIVRDHPPE